jgi:hypothetical protein
MHLTILKEQLQNFQPSSRTENLFHIQSASPHQKTKRLVGSFSQFEKQEMNEGSFPEENKASANSNKQFPIAFKK